MAEQDRHIKFADLHEEPSSISNLKHRSKASMSGSSFSLSSNKCRRIVANFILPRILIEPPTLRKCPPLLTYLLSEDFEEFSVEKLGTRRLNVNLGPFSLPDDDDEMWDTHSSVTSASGKSADSFPLYSVDDDLLAVPNGFIKGTEDSSDEHIRRAHVDISVGKGGVFTRTTYRYKQWSSILHSELAKADLIIVALCDGELDDSHATLETPDLAITWCLTKGIQQIGQAESTLSSQILVILEALCLNKNIILYKDFEGSADQFYVSLFEALCLCKSVHKCEEIGEFVDLVLTFEDFDHEKVEIPSEFNDFVVKSNEDALKWIKMFTSLQAIQR